MDNLLSILLDTSMLEKPLKQFKELQDRYEKMYKDYRNMLDENLKMREEFYKDTLVAELKSKNEQLSKRLSESFEISTEEQKKINEWEEKHKKECLSDDFEYCFYPWAFGIEARVECKKCGKFYIFREE